ncbi:hypothetical protein GCK72_007643 [Caenorhabditis remanei]|uniref:DUF38 domain-containing protein n=1 Tax=Caenorhabditis remanei TaxID=31234 RepID=A0A6A5HM49_CAERE|nr:hypothetical protein GCK72_007643 [Caenorhabditis remanei]KAF1767684.1 hypothetical protein GCK72_007643 [Caenorhabditis remanei]
MPCYLSYPSLRTVLEHLEANKRIYLVSRCPSVQRFEKSIPLHLNNMSVEEHCIILNKVRYAFLEDAEERPRGYFSLRRSDAPLWKHIPQETSLKLCFKHEEREYSNLLSTIRSSEKGFEELVNYLVGGRKMIRVEKLAINMRQEVKIHNEFSPRYSFLREKPPKAPKLKLNFKCRAKELIGDDYLYLYLPLIAESSYPLKKIECYMNDEIQDHPAVQQAEHVVDTSIADREFAIQFD